MWLALFIILLIYWYFQDAGNKYIKEKNKAEFERSVSERDRFRSKYTDWEKEQKIRNGLRIKRPPVAVAKTDDVKEALARVGFEDGSVPESNAFYREWAYLIMESDIMISLSKEGLLSYVDMATSTWRTEKATPEEYADIWKFHLYIAKLIDERMQAVGCEPMLFAGGDPKAGIHEVTEGEVKKVQYMNDNDPRQGCFFYETGMSINIVPSKDR